MTKQVYRADIRPYQDRIAALEAELKEKSIAYRNECTDREKAEAKLLRNQEYWEAEVERLKAWVCPFDMTLCEIHIHERGGRESGTLGGGISPSGVSPSPPLCKFCGRPLTDPSALSHPAIPAARHYADCICTECEAARKEAR